MIKLLKTPFIIILFFFLNFYFIVNIDAQVSANKWYNIESKVNNLYLDVKGGSHDSKTLVWMYTPNNSVAQQWMFIKTNGGYYYIKSRVSGLYLDVQGGSKEAKTLIWQYLVNHTASQQWKIINAGGGYYYLQAKVSGLYLDVQGGLQASGTAVWQYNYNQSNSQKWKFKLVNENKTILQAKYLGNYPSDRQNGWSDQLQGVGHDENNWFFTQKGRLWKFPITHDLNISVNLNNLPEGVISVKIPDFLQNKGYNHYCDFVEYKGYLFIPLEAEDGANNNKPLLTVYSASTLTYITSAPMSHQTKAGWCAINPTNGLLYTSQSSMNSANRLISYRINLTALLHNRLVLTYVGIKTLFNESGNAISIKPYMQGGEFSDDGKYLFLVNGRASSSTAARDGGIWVFDFNSGKKVLKSETNGSFKFEYHPGVPNLEEPEGITYWDLENRNAPNIKGKLHVILLNNDVTSKDEFWFKHYSINL